MKPELRTNFSDLDRARALARELERGTPAPAPGEGAFSFSFGSVVPRDERRAAVPEFSVALPPGAPWSRVVDHCLAQTGAMGMVVVDEAGFVVASAGHWRDWSELHLEAVSARLMAALDQIERLEGPWGHCDSMVLSLGADFLTGVRVDTSTGRLTLALLASLPLPDGVRRALQAQIRAAMGER